MPMYVYDMGKEKPRMRNNVTAEPDTLSKAYVWDFTLSQGDL